MRDEKTRMLAALNSCEAPCSGALKSCTDVTSLTSKHQMAHNATRGRGRDFVESKGDVDTSVV